MVGGLAHTFEECFARPRSRYWCQIAQKVLINFWKPIKKTFDANPNRHTLRSNKQYWNTCSRKLKFRFLIEPWPNVYKWNTKGISNRPWPNDYNGITNRRYKVWTPQGRIFDKFRVLEESKEEQSLTFSDFYSIIPLLQWVHATYKAWLKIEKHTK